MTAEAAAASAKVRALFEQTTVFAGIINLDGVSLGMSQHDPIQLLPSVVVAGGDACVDKSRLAADLLASIKNLGAGD